LNDIVLLKTLTLIQTLQDDTWRNVSISEYRFNKPILVAAPISVPRYRNEEQTERDKKKNENW